VVHRLTYGGHRLVGVVRRQRAGRDSLFEELDFEPPPLVTARVERECLFRIAIGPLAYRPLAAGNLDVDRPIRRYTAPLVYLCAVHESTLSVVVHESLVSRASRGAPIETIEPQCRV